MRPKQENPGTTDPTGIESRILDHLDRQGPCTMDGLVRALPSFTWNQVFLAVVKLSRERTLTLRRGATYDYLVARGIYDLPS